jgi:hypothetical protein
VLGAQRHEMRYHHRRRPGLMQAANEGARSAEGSQKCRHPGALPFEQKANPFVENRASILVTLLPGAHAIGHTFVKVRRAHRCLHATQPHLLSYLVAHAG